MANYQWEPSVFGRMIALPSVVAEQQLKMAGAVQLKVLLWFAANGGTFDADACAAAVGYSAADCLDAMQYWAACGVLHGEQTASAPSGLAAAVVPAAPIARPRAVKPQMKEVIAAQRSTPSFAYLLDTVSARLGKPLTHGDMETLLYLTDTAGLPAEVVLMVVEYAVQTDHYSMRYIEKTALDWADKEITTIAAAEEHLCRLERCREALLKVQTVCALPKPLSATVGNMNYAEKWVFLWMVADDLLRLAYAMCAEKTGTFQAKYIDRVLENWRAQGITTAEQAAALTAVPKAATVQDEQPSDYEQMVENYIPVYKRKKKKG